MENPQIQQMVDFIIQEAKEKVNEIHLKTTHDSNLEKQMTIHNAKNKIQKEFKQKEKQMETEQRIKVSRSEAQYRVKKMNVREELLEEVKGMAITSLQSVITDASKYESMLTDLIVQGLIKLNEIKVDIVVRECDKSLADKVTPKAVKKYVDLIKEATEQTCTAPVLTVNPGGKCLPPASDGSGKASCAGGVKLFASQGRIVCDNTLDSRLAVSFDELMPEVRSKLFSTRV